MPIIGAAVAGAVGLTGAAAAVAGSLINIGVAVGLAYVSRSLQGASAGQETGLQTTVDLGGDQPRGFILGETGTAGHLVYFNTSGVDNFYLQQVFVLGEGPHEGLTRIWVNGVEKGLTLLSSDQWKRTYSVDGFVSAIGGQTLFVDFWHGYQDQPVSADLVTYASPASRWTAQDRLAGMCYAAVRAGYVDTLYDSGIPRFLFGVKGRRLYDWRKDTTVGGAGAHRWDDEHSWAYSENPIVGLYNYQRGLSLGGELVVGMGVPPVDLISGMYTAAANACDVPVTEASGGEVARYRCATYVAATEEHGAVMERILESCAGSLYERAGAYGPIAGVAQTVTFPTITDGDLVVGQPVRFAAKASRSDLVNGVFGSYASVADQYQLVAYPARTDAAAEVEDTEIRHVQVDYPQVPYQAQAQRLAELTLKLARLQATASITLGLAAIVLEPGDWVRWNSARYGDRTYVVLSLTQNTDQTVTLNLRQVSTAAYGWTVGDEAPAPTPGEESVPAAQANGVTGFSLLAMTLTGAGGVKSPAVRAFWTPITDQTITAVVLEYRITGTTDVLSERTTAVGNGEYLLKAGLVSETEYEVRATIETTPARTAVWTAWLSVTTTQQVVPSTPAPNSITPAQFTEATRDLVVSRLLTAIETLQDGLSQLALIVADVDAAGDLNKRELSRSLTVQVGSALARFTEQIAVLASENAAIAEQVTELEASLGSIDANLKARYVVAVTPAGAIAAYELQATAEEASAGFRIIAMDDGAGGAVGQVSINADRFFITGSEDIGTAVFLVDNTGPTPVVYLNGDLIANGTITANKLDVAVLSAIVANLGEIVAGIIRSADSRFYISADDGYILVTS